MTTSTMTDAPPRIDPAQTIFQLATGYVVTAALQTVVKLRVADHLADGPRPVAELAAATGVNEDALYRVLRALETVGLFQETAGRRFALTPASELLRSDRPGLYHLALWISSPFHFRVYSNALEAVRTGEPAAEKTVGMPAFEYFTKDRELSEIFNNAMTAFSAMVIPTVLEAYDFSGIDTLVDVAGGHGAVLTSILQKYPSMRGVLCDVDHVIAGAKPKIAALNLQDRCETTAVDFFKAVPAGGDAYIMKHIIHDWDDERASVILKNIRTALDGKRHGKVILLESVIRTGPESNLAKLMDLEMLMMPGGRERTEDEFRALFAKSGFELTRIVPTQSPVSVIEAVPVK
jgi:O-methyltransferase/methyltransferase family protein